MMNGVSLRNSYNIYPTQEKSTDVVDLNSNTNREESDPLKPDVDRVVNGEKKEAVSNKKPLKGEVLDKDEIKNNPEVQNTIQQLVVTENKVIAHEQAHMSAGGEFAGAANYSYTVGPDGKRYITGGEVSISTPSVDEPEEKIRVLERVKQAALAPAEPSSQDMRVASNATTQIGKAQMEIATQKAEKAYGSEKDGNGLDKGRTSVNGTRTGKDERNALSNRFEMVI